MEREALEAMMRPLDGDDPCGENCEYDELFLQLESLATGEAARVMGDSVVEGRDPDWRGVRRVCGQLWQKTRDLRVAVYLALAGLATDGLDAFADGLELVRWLFAEQWEGFWPRLDPDDDNDPLERMNTMAMLSPPPGSYDDPVRFASLLRRVRLVPSGPRYTLRDLLIAEGELEAGDEKVDAALLTAEVRAVSADVRTAQAAAVARVNGLAEAIAGVFAERAAGAALSFQTLMDGLKPLARFYARIADEPSPAGAASEPDAPADTAAAVSAASAPAFSLETLTVRTREEALTLLRKAEAYFRSAEPSSPIPYFLARAQRMATMDFMAILGEIDPSGTDRGRDILGVREEGY